jgi:hypothetical protein
VFRFLVFCMWISKFPITIVEETVLLSSWNLSSLSKSIVHLCYNSFLRSSFWSTGL